MEKVFPEIFLFSPEVFRYQINFYALKLKQRNFLGYTVMVNAVNLVLQKETGIGMNSERLNINKMK